MRLNKSVPPPRLLSIPIIVMVATSIFSFPCASQQFRVASMAVKPDSKTLAMNSLDQNSCFLPTVLTRCIGDKDHKDANINSFYQTTGALSYFGQIKSIYNGASSSATVSADLASLNFTNGMQVTAGTNIQAGSTGVTAVSAGTLPTLSSAAAGQATQNMLYGGTVYALALLPVYSYDPNDSSATGALSTRVDFIAREGVDIQNFKTGTSTNVTSPPSHFSAQLQGYLLYNSINLTSDNSSSAGAVFLGGSYGYSYTSHDYLRDYGFADKASSNIGQVSAGILITGVAKISVSRGFGPSQKYTDSTSMLPVVANNFKTFSFGISYQSPAPAAR